MPISSLLVANRGEIAVRILRTAAEMGIRTIAVYSEDDAESLHTRMADVAVPLPGSGPAPYLDIAAILAAAAASGADAVHPGYGFLSEQAALAEACASAGITFVGPSPAALGLLGDKAAAREAARSSGLPVLEGTDGPASLEQAERFVQSLPAGARAIIKAVAGGGGRGVRIVSDPAELPALFERASSEALGAFGDGRLYLERLVSVARHVEVQVLGDGTGAVVHLGERDCSLQRRHQKLIEIAPAPGLPPALRDRITAAAVSLASSLSYANAGTFEFLVEAEGGLRDDSPFFFIEANARLQVEHTVTEAVTGLDLVQLQIEIAGGATLAVLNLHQSNVPAPRGFAIQARVNMETLAADGSVRPSAGVLTAFDPPSGPGIRVDTFGYSGYRTGLRFDSLLAKIIAHSPQPRIESAVARARRALSEFRIAGVETNLPLLDALLAHPALLDGSLHTRFIDDHAGELAVTASSGAATRRYVEVTAPASARSGLAGARVDTADPLAVLSYGQAARTTKSPESVPAVRSDGAVALSAPLQGTVVSVLVTEGDTVASGQVLAIMESMKMEHEIRATSGGIIRSLGVTPGDTVYEGHALLYIEETAAGEGIVAVEEAVDLDEIRPDLAEVLERRHLTRDSHRPKAVERRHTLGYRTTRENVDDLCDPGTFVEYGPLVLAAQRARRTLDDLLVRSPADGLVTGVGSVNGQLFDDPAARCAVMAYDYTVFAGTQGNQNHRKTDRIIDIAEEARLPFVLFAEGGGGRPGDTDGLGVSTQRTFSRFAQLSALVPMVGITNGRCFAGNASLLGCCDVIIATEGSNIGMGGPAMIEGGGLGIYAPEDIGPMEVQVPSGVVDILVKDEAEAVATAKKYLSYFQGKVSAWSEHDQRQMRRIIPENRLRVYDVRRVIETLADVDSVLELRSGFGHGMITSLIRIEGRPVGIVANNPAHLGGAIDADASDKGARFMQLCDAFDIPILFLCDTPGIMVGPDIEKTALVRKSSRMFLVGANLAVPFFTIILRKAYGLGAIAMAGGSYKVPYFTVSWPTGEFGGMGLEGMVKLGYRDDLAAITDPDERRQRYEEMVARAYEHGKALNDAALFGIDDTIDPAESRFWLSNLLKSIRPPMPRDGKKRAMVDGW
ncbi:MAG: carboxyl transferase domain-containing protein [Dehalococcoidia bacterium]